MLKLTVAGRHPLKQGLKPSCYYFVLYLSNPVAGRHPLKQGLKLLTPNDVMYVLRVAGRHPLKQGLKLHGSPIPRYPCVVAGRHPLKQGLKRFIILPVGSSSKSQGGIH